MLDVIHMLEQKEPILSHIDPYVPNLESAHAGLSLALIELVVRMA